MVTTLIIYISFLTLIIIGGIHRYEDKIKILHLEIDWWSSSKLSNAEHYTYLQLENKELKDAIHDYKRALNLAKNAMSNNNVNLIRDLDAQNTLLQSKIAILKEQIVEIKSGIHTGYINPNIQ